MADLRPTRPHYDLIVLIASTSTLFPHQVTFSGSGKDVQFGGAPSNPTHGSRLLVRESAELSLSWKTVPDLTQTKLAVPLLSPEGTLSF